MTDCVNWSCVARALGVRLDPARRSTGRRDVGAGAYTLADGGSWVLGAAGEGGSGSQSPGTAAAEPGGYLPRWEQPGSAVHVAGPHATMRCLTRAGTGSADPQPCVPEK